LLGYGIRDQLNDLNVLVHSFYHEEALEGDAAQLAFSILSLLVDQEDRVALRWWLGHESPSGRRNAYQKLRQYCEQSGTSPKGTLDAIVQGALKLSGVSDLVNKYRELQELLAGLAGQGLDQVIDTLMPDGDEECSVLREMSLLAVPDVKDIRALFDRVKTQVTQPEMPAEGNFVRVMSLHKSKGLTTRVTIVAGCTQGLIPFHKSDTPPVEQEAVLREQRRLFYVAITR